MWKVTSVTSRRSARWTASHTEASSPCGGRGSSGTGDRQPSGRLVGFIEAEAVAKGSAVPRERESNAAPPRPPPRLGQPFWGMPQIAGKAGRGRFAQVAGGAPGRPYTLGPHEAHLPAQEAQASSNAWVPWAH